jgi:hypothetical protein
MKHDEFSRLVGADVAEAEYLPVACLLSNGYGCAGHFVPSLNKGFTDACVLVNARLIDLRGGGGAGPRRTIDDFNEFLEEIVLKAYRKEESTNSGERFGRSIPLMALSYDQIALVYPVAHISTLMHRAAEAEPAKKTGAAKEVAVPSFLDFERRSIVLKLLRTKLW